MKREHIELPVAVVKPLPWYRQIQKLLGNSDAEILKKMVLTSYSAVSAPSGLETGVYHRRPCMIPSVDRKVYRRGPLGEVHAMSRRAVRRAEKIITVSELRREHYRGVWNPAAYPRDPNGVSDMFSNRQIQTHRNSQNLWPHRTTILRRRL